MPKNLQPRLGGKASHLVVKDTLDQCSHQIGKIREDQQLAPGRPWMILVE